MGHAHRGPEMIGVQFQRLMAIVRRILKSLEREIADARAPPVSERPAAYTPATPVNGVENMR